MLSKLFFKSTVEIAPERTATVQSIIDKCNEDVKSCSRSSSFSIISCSQYDPLLEGWEDLSEPLRDGTPEIHGNSSISKANNCLSSHTSLEKQKSCGHICTLSIDICCACSDKRSHQPGYDVYIDGIGVKKTAERWTFYCPSCRVSDNICNSYEVKSVKAIEQQTKPAPIEKEISEDKSSSSSIDSNKTQKPIITSLLATSYPNTSLKSCGHHCTLSIDGCCACLDRRTGLNYLVYVDGVGYTYNHDKAMYYCPVCKINYPTVRAAIEGKPPYVIPPKAPQYKAIYPSVHKEYSSTYSELYADLKMYGKQRRYPKKRRNEW